VAWEQPTEKQQRYHGGGAVDHKQIGSGGLPKFAVGRFFELICNQPPRAGSKESGDRCIKAPAKSAIKLQRGAILLIRSYTNVSTRKRYERTGLIMRQNAFGALARGHNDLGQRIGEHEGWCPNCSPGHVAYEISRRGIHHRCRGASNSTDANAASIAPSAADRLTSALRISTNVPSSGCARQTLSEMSIRGQDPFDTFRDVH
jgi:hypothetical protein